MVDLRGVTLQGKYGVGPKVSIDRTTLSSDFLLFGGADRLWSALSNGWVAQLMALVALRQSFDSCKPNP